MPFVMVTAHDASRIAAAYREGAYDYVLKPVDVVLLRASVRRALQCRGLRIANKAYRAELAKNAKAGLDGL
jgi:DNA-binding NtrC family response regulator